MTLPRQKACCCSPRSFGCGSAKPRLARALGSPLMTRLLQCPQVSPVTSCSLPAIPGGGWYLEKKEGFGAPLEEAPSLLLRFLKLRTAHCGDDKVPPRVCCGDADDV